MSIKQRHRAMNAFWTGDTYRIVQKIKAGGNQPGVIQLWKNMVEHWALKATGPDAEAVKAFLPLWQARPFYTAAELAPIFPVLAVALGLRERPASEKSAARLAVELDYAQLPRLNSGNGDLGIYFIVERVHYWRERVVGVQEFAEILNANA